MKFKHLTEEEAAKGNLIDPGIYCFVVLDAEDQISKSGSEMIKLTLRIQDSEGFAHTVFDYLLEKMKFKLRHFCEHTGLLEKYESDELTAADCLDKTGVCEIIVQPGQDKYDGGKYPDKNSVKDYLEGKLSMSKDKVPETTGHPAFSDDIPF